MYSSGVTTISTLGLPFVCYGRMNFDNTMATLNAFVPKCFHFKSPVD